MITLSIIIYVASPLDYARYRHAALYLEYGGPPENGDTNANTEANANADTNAETPSPLKSSVAEIVGSTGFFTFVERLNWQPPISSTGEAPTSICNLPIRNFYPPIQSNALPVVFCHCAVHCLLVLRSIYLHISTQAQHLCICICISMHKVSLDSPILTLSNRYSTRHTRRYIERIWRVYNTICKPQSGSRSKSQSGSNQQN
jgi:hypothetical protein